MEKKNLKPPNGLGYFLKIWVNVPTFGHLLVYFVLCTFNSIFPLTFLALGLGHAILQFFLHIYIFLFIFLGCLFFINRICNARNLLLLPVAAALTV